MHSSPRVMSKSPCRGRGLHERSRWRSDLVPGRLGVRLIILAHLMPVTQQRLRLLCGVEAHQACTPAFTSAREAALATKDPTATTGPARRLIVPAAQRNIIRLSQQLRRLRGHVSARALAKRNGSLGSASWRQLRALASCRIPGSGEPCLCRCCRCAAPPRCPNRPPAPHPAAWAPASGSRAARPRPGRSR